MIKGRKSKKDASEEGHWREPPEETASKERASERSKREERRRKENSNAKMDWAANFNYLYGPRWP